MTYVHGVDPPIPEPMGERQPPPRTRPGPEPARLAPRMINGWEQPDPVTTARVACPLCDDDIASGTEPEHLRVEHRHDINGDPMGFPHTEHDKARLQRGVDRARAALAAAEAWRAAWDVPDPPPPPTTEWERRDYGDGLAAWTRPCQSWCDRGLIAAPARFCPDCSGTGRETVWERDGARVASPDRDAVAQ